MIERSTHGDVTALRLTWWRSRLVGYAVHVFLVRRVLVDSGFPAAADDVRAIVREMGSTSRHGLRGAFVTHAHEDHAGNLALLASLGIPLAVGARTLTRAAAPGPIGFYRHFTWRQMPILRVPPEPFADDALSLVATPGHSPDHHAVWDAETGTLFAGDLFLGVRVKLAHPYEDPRAQVRSLRAMIARAPARVFCAHRGLLPDGVAMLRAKADWMEETIARIDALAREGRSVREIRRAVLGRRGGTHWFSAGDYSPENLVAAVLRRGGPAEPGR